MQVSLLAVGKRMPAWVNQGFDEYAKRLTGTIKLQLIEIEAGKRSKNSDIRRILMQEGEAMLAAMPPHNKIIALDVKGKQWSTEQLAQQLAHWQQEGRGVNLLVGGPEGLSLPCLEKAEQSWSLSALTFPHPLVRVIIAEQLYRAYSLLQGHPYHRG